MSEWFAKRRIRTAVIIGIVFIVMSLSFFLINSSLLNTSFFSAHTNTSYNTPSSTSYNIPSSSANQNLNIHIFEYISFLNIENAPRELFQYLYIEPQEAFCNSCIMMEVDKLIHNIEDLGKFIEMVKDEKKKVVSELIGACNGSLWEEYIRYFVEGEIEDFIERAKIYRGRGQEYIAKHYISVAYVEISILKNLTENSMFREIFCSITIEDFINQVYKFYRIVRDPLIKVFNETLESIDYSKIDRLKYSAQYRYNIYVIKYYLDKDKSILLNETLFMESLYSLPIQTLRTLVHAIKNAKLEYMLFHTIDKYGDLPGVFMNISLVEDLINRSYESYIRLLKYNKDPLGVFVIYVCADYIKTTIKGLYDRLVDLYYEDNISYINYTVLEKYMSRHEYFVLFTTLLFLPEVIDYIGYFIELYYQSTVI